MIETDYHTIPTNIYDKIKEQAEELGISIDYFLMEFCKVSDSWIKGGTPKVDL